MSACACHGEKPALVQSFEIDGKLWALRREECFTLGVEWGITWQQATLSAPFQVTIHADNLDRIGPMLVQQKRTFLVKQAGAGWVTLSVAGLE